MSDFLEDVIDLNDLRGCHHYEPYAGGAGAALTLLEKKVVDKIFLNDADPRVFAFWNAVLNETDRFADRVLSVPLDIKEWHRQREICSNPSPHSSFDIGFSAFYMNRCNRSGILNGAGPIGGLQQNGKWKLNARFNRVTLAQRIRKTGAKSKQIQVSCMDAIDFLRSSLPVGKARRNTFVYLDPPYVNKAQRLYLNAYRPDDHAGIARYLSSQTALPWLMSYDDTQLIRNLYRKRHIFKLPIRYSLKEKRLAMELITCPLDLILPRSVQVHGVKAPFFQPGPPSQKHRSRAQTAQPTTEKLLTATSKNSAPTVFPSPRQNPEKK